MSDGRYHVMLDVASGWKGAFDRETDPAETANLFAEKEPPRAVEELYDRLVVAVGTSEGGRVQQNVRRAERVEQGLHELGYLQ